MESWRVFFVAQMFPEVSWSQWFFLVCHGVMSSDQFLSNGMDKQNHYMGVSLNGGIPKWMVYKGKPYQNEWFGGTTIFGNIHILIRSIAG